MNLKLGRLQKYTLAGAYGWLIFIWWLPLIIDPTLYLTAPRRTPIGWISGTGSLTRLLGPFGINFFNLIIVILTFVTMLRNYRVQRSPLVRGQIRYQSAAILLILGSGYAFNIAQFFGGLNLLPYVASAGIAVLLLGLRKHGFYFIAPAAEVQEKTPLKHNLEEGSAYLIVNTDTLEGFKYFADLTKHGYLGLCITRRSPDKVRQNHGLEATPILRLTEEKDQNTVPPTDLHGLFVATKTFLQGTGHHVMMLDGLEYLISINGFGAVLRFIARLSDLVELKRDLLLLPLVPEALTDREHALLSIELPTLQKLELPSVKPIGTTAALPDTQQGDIQLHLQFESEDASKTFSFLAKAFLQDYAMQRVFIDAAGWQTSSAIAKGADLPNYRIYGSRGQPGSALVELLKRGLVETRWFPEHRGRGGKIMKIRVNYDNPYAKAEVDRLGFQPMKG